MLAFLLIGQTVLALVAGATSAIAGAAVTGSSPRGCGSDWSLAPIVPIEHHAPLYVNAVGASSAADAWIATEGPVFQHWDGTAWTSIPSPPLGTYEVQGIGANSPDDAWAVGYQYKNVRTHVPEILHWNGTSWDLAPSPQRLGFGLLSSVDPVGPNDVWAVGEQAGGKTLIEHWDGSEWTVVPSPSPPAKLWSSLDAVSVDAADDGWAVGERYMKEIFNGTTYRYVHRPLLVRWDGSRWIQVAVPEGIHNLTGIVAFAPDDAWGVGYTGPDTVAIHWNGESWSVVPTPNLTRRASFAAVGSLGPNDTWAVGSRWNRAHVQRTLIEQWDGTAWHLVTSPNGGSGDSALIGISAVPGQLIAVGSADSYNDPLVLERCA